MFVFCVAYKGPYPLPMWLDDTIIWAAHYDALLPPDDPAVEYPRPHYLGKALNVMYFDGHVGRTKYPIPEDNWFWTK